MAKLHVLALAPSRSHSAEIADVLHSLDAQIHEGYNGQDVGRIIRDTEIGLVVFAGELPGLSAERILTAVCERVPQAILVIALPNTQTATALAQRFHGHALPWPLNERLVRELLEKPKPGTYITPRREHRMRFFGGVTVTATNAQKGGVLINVSPHGAMVLSEHEGRKGDKIALQIPYGAETYAIEGTVKHTGTRLNREEALEAAPWLNVERPRVFGLELAPASVATATKLCARLTDERKLLNLRVTCVPAVPKGLTQVLQQYGSRVESLRELPEEFKDLPPILLIDVSTCSLAELDRVLTLRRRSVVIGIASTPITDKLRSQLASRLPGIFVLPFQNENLVRHIEDFFAPVDRKFPRIEEPFTVLTKRGGGTLALDGLDLSLHGCALASPTAIEPGSELEGTLAMDQAIDAYPFRGKIVYCLPSGGTFRIGLSFEIQGKAVASYQKYLSSRFLKQMRARWEEQLTANPV
jgi:hypothetical protein